MDKQSRCPYQREWYNPILIVNKSAIENFDEANYYKDEGFSTSLRN